MRRRLPLLSLLALLALLPFAVTADAPVARVQTLKGAARVVDLGRETDAAAGMALHDGFAVKGGPDTRMTILFNDGNVRFVGRNASMTWKALAPAPAAAGNAAAVVGYVLSDGPSEVFRNVVTGAAMRRRSPPEGGAAAQGAPEAEFPGRSPLRSPAPERDGAARPYATERKSLDTLKPLPTPAPPEATPQAAPELPAPSEALLEEAPETADDGLPGTTEMAAPPAQADKEREKRKSEEEARPWTGERGFFPKRGGLLAPGRGRFAAPPVAGAESYRLRIYPAGETAPVFESGALAAPRFEAGSAAPALAPLTPYEYAFEARRTAEAPLASSRRAFVLLDATREAELLARAAEVDALSGVASRPLLKALLFAKAGLADLARDAAEEAARAADPDVTQAAADLIETLDGREE